MRCASDTALLGRTITSTERATRWGKGGLALISNGGRLTRHAARELGYDGIRINVVTPGGTNTPLMEEVGKLFSEEHKRARLAGIPMEQRWADAREVGEAIHFALFGPRYFHGADLRIDGGI